MIDAVRGLSAALLGPGRAGRAFARSWLAAGGRLELVIARSRERARIACAELGAGTPQFVGAASGRCDVLAIAVPDDAIASAAREVSGRMTAAAAFHFSGALPAARLEPLSPGTQLGSLHPLRVFSGLPGEDWKGAFVAIEGEEEATQLGAAIVAAFSARGRRIDPAAKPLYHAAATLAAGGTVSLLSIASRAWSLAGIPEEEGRPALAGLAAEAAGSASRQPFAEALTGPIARRDLDTVAAHRRALEREPALLEVYRFLARETLARTPGMGKEKEILTILGC